MGSSVPLNDTFAAAVTCIDGRTHDPLVQWVRQHLGVDHVDLITQPGADAAVSGCPEQVCDGIRERLSVSVVAHASRAAVVAGHDDCAANPVSAAVHRAQIAASVEEIRRWGLGIEVHGLWIESDGTVTRIPLEPLALSLE